MKSIPLTILAVPVRFCTPARARDVRDEQVKFSPGIGGWLRQKKGRRR